MKSSPLLWVRFVGENLDKKSVPIYELADTLIAFQRIVHKIHLYHEDRLTKGAHLGRGERLRVSLQIADHRKQSDAWALLPFVTDPAIIGYVHDLVRAGLIELSKYALKRIFLPEGKSQKVEGSAVTGSIYGETVSITNHIYNIGKVERIEFRFEGSSTVRPVVITEETQDYVRAIRNKTYRGGKTTIDGVVMKLDLNRDIVEVRYKPRHYVKIHVDESQLRRIQAEAKRGDTLRFRGYPIFRLGREFFEEFEADRYLGVTKSADDE